MTAKTLDELTLRMFTGSESYYRNGIVPSVRFTEGAKYVADAAGAYWLLDEIALAQRAYNSVRAQPFQVWKLRVFEDRTASLTCDNGNGREVFVKAIPWTDFPRDELSFWFSDDTIYLPSER